MKTAPFTEDMILERGDAIRRIRREERLEEAQLRKNMDRPIWREWLFWLGVFFFFGARRGEGVDGLPEQLFGVVLMILALDMAARTRSRAARELEQFFQAKKALPKA
ncbi:MAG: hypothetical protein IPK32_14990 [Verrucomicrobiaceae bacterium]|nr:hypothetical protein [Verrucomicrobiaceae bacterium]